jgi:hypothetical protein
MTSNPTLWAFLEQYSDLIVNGLDLVSFLLVTPEVVLLVRPLVQGKSGARILRVSAAVFTSYVTMFGGNAVRIFLASDAVLLGNIARFFPFFAGMLVFVAFDFCKERVMPLSLRERLSKLFSFNLLFFGMALFLLARMLAFAVASHKAFGVP